MGEFLGVTCITTNESYKQLKDYIVHLPGEEMPG
jgi:hypothetical protein